VQEGDLGTVSMGTVYTSLTLFSVAASPVVTRIGPKRALVVGTSGYVLFILANLVPTWCVRLWSCIAILSGRHGCCASVWGACVGSELDAWYLFDKRTLGKMQEAFVWVRDECRCYLINSCLIVCCSRSWVAFV